jgi:transcriptional regulator with XRE-family HTH domain
MEQEKKGAGRPISTHSPWGDLYRSVGGQKNLADRLGVSKSTVGKWAMGMHRVPEIVKKELLSLCSELGIKEGIDKLKAGSN